MLIILYPVINEKIPLTINHEINNIVNEVNESASDIEVKARVVV